MRKAKQRSRKTQLTKPVCEEKLACLSPEDIPVFRCEECETLQCAACEEELHKDGQPFFHVRVPWPPAAPEKTITPPQDPEEEDDPFHSLEDTPRPLVEVPTASPIHSSPASDSGIVDIPRNSAHQLEHSSPVTHRTDPFVVNKLSDEEFESFSDPLEHIEPPLIDLTTPGLSVSKAMKGHSKKNKSKRRSNGSLNSLSSDSGNEGSGGNKFLGMDISVDYFSQEHEAGSALTGGGGRQRNGSNDEELISDLMKSVTHLDLSSPAKPAPRTPGRNSHMTDVDLQSPPMPSPAARMNPTSDVQYPSRQLTSASNDRPNKPDVVYSDSFLLVDENEKIQVKDDAAFSDRLDCKNGAKVKVVAIFGNAGVGKSYTLNHVFFDGHEVFTTSPDMDRCTAGVWTSYNSTHNVICIDTEGLLGISENENRRTRLLLKILAISDIVIYRTTAERLHTDMFQFLGDASVAYQKHFKIELQDLASRKQPDGQEMRSVQSMGPAVIIFHETTKTNPLREGGHPSPVEIIQDKFQECNRDISAFSSLHYVGVKTQTQTDFSAVTRQMLQLINDDSSRVPRSPRVIYNMLKTLNDKFADDIYSPTPNSFPSEFFTCSFKCLSCSVRCTHNMNHKEPHHIEKSCRYTHVYDNKVYICKGCFMKRGVQNAVVPKTSASQDNTVVAVARYAWAGYILECRDCGIIYRSRQHWYGNKDPTEEQVQIEIRHIWPGEAAMLTGTHNAARKLLDGVKHVADTVGGYSSKPARLLSDWVADQVAPPYWVPNNQVYECETCKSIFGDQEKKHHCRDCGQAFCDECTQFSKPVPSRGWENSVRVCEQCYEKPSEQSNTAGDTDTAALLPRQAVESVQSMLGTVAQVAINYPFEVIKDSARPAYWVPDHLITKCDICKTDFSAKLHIHHCRSCGNGVCHVCSKTRRHVPSKGWDKPVRVCDKCNRKNGEL